MKPSPAPTAHATVMQIFSKSMVVAHNVHPTLDTTQHQKVVFYVAQLRFQSTQFVSVKKATI